MIQVLHRPFVFLHAAWLAAATGFGFFVPSMPGRIPAETGASFIRHRVTGDFISEGVAVADINGDGQPDIIAGSTWFAAPDWKAHAIAPQVTYDPATAYSNSFLNFCLDVNQDGRIDVIRISLPGEEAVWYENRGDRAGDWPMHLILAHAGNESPMMADIDGDGRNDLLCNDPVAREMVWMESPRKKGDSAWTRHLIAGGGAEGTGRYTHGLGWIDMNGDGRKDVVITKGWWECPPDPAIPSPWRFHPAGLGEDCSQMLQLPEKGSAVPVVITASAHHYGIWSHHVVPGGNPGHGWTSTLIDSSFSQSHGVAVADVNGDGYPDIITGKRYFAHNGKDPGAFEPAVLYWFENLQGSQPGWKKHLVDDNSGVGLQVMAADMNGDGLTDIVVSNKKGVFYFQQAGVNHRKGMVK